MWRIRYRQLEALPKLAWLAEVDADKRVVHVSHGSAVECHPHWCVEGVWEDAFEDGDFHRVENLFGSGIRADADKLVFCSSVSVTDRLVHVVWKKRVLVSNSLVQLLARTGARLDPAHDYAEETFASSHGIHRYPNAIRVRHSDFAAICQDYHCNLEFSGNGLTRIVRSAPRRFVSFDAYCDALWTSLRGIRDNYQSPARRHAINAFTTTSTGYDSVAVSALAKQLGVTRTFTTDDNPQLIAQHRESGVEIANALGLNVLKLRNAIDSVSPLERFFLAAGIDGSEVFYQGLSEYLKENCELAVLYTGYHGDVVWNRGNGPPAFPDDIRRKDASGLQVAEGRLQAGFINLALPLMYARNQADISAISQSPEMQAWSVGGEYDRPIPRRIAETAGVARQLFGMHKRAQLVYYDSPRNLELKRQFTDYLAREIGISPLQLKWNDCLRRIDHAIIKAFRSESRLPRGRTINLRSLMFVWAANSLAGTLAELYRERERVEDISRPRAATP
jgi:hypothetical protein